MVKKILVIISLFSLLVGMVFATNGSFGTNDSLDLEDNSENLSDANETEVENETNDSLIVENNSEEEDILNESIILEDNSSTNESVLNETNHSFVNESTEDEINDTEILDECSDVIDTGLSIILYPIKDSFIRKDAKNINDGVNHFLVIQKKDDRILIAFDDDLIKSSIEGKNLVSAKLRFYYEFMPRPDRSGEIKGQVGIFSLLQNWVEGNGYSLLKENNYLEKEPTGTGEGVTWNCPVDNDISNRKEDCRENKWKGGSIGRSLDNASVEITEGMYKTVEFDVTPDVLDFINEEKDNYGWVIEKIGNGTDEMFGSLLFLASETQFKPELVLEYYSSVENVTFEEEIIIFENVILDDVFFENSVNEVYGEELSFEDLGVEEGSVIEVFCEDCNANGKVDLGENASVVFYSNETMSFDTGFSVFTDLGNSFSGFVSDKIVVDVEGLK